MGLFPENAQERETDEFDSFSSLCMIRHKQSQVFAGCVRIVSPTQANEELPLQHYCRDAYQGHELSPDQLTQSEICEYSRLAVRPEFRRRKSDHIKNTANHKINETNFSEDEIRCFPFISIGLYLTGIALSIEMGKKHGFVMVEPRLAKSMRKIGINFVQLGEPVNYHGLRAPYYCNEEILLKSLAFPIRDLMEVIRLQVREQIAEHPILLKSA
jgi:N-acyl amino acid synthase of PEP-CTERM/exosortase system